MKRVLFVVTLVCSVFVFPGRSHAESYLSAYLGGAFPHDSDMKDNTGGDFSGEIEFDNGVAIGVKAGHWFSEQNAPYFGLELDLNAHFPKTDKIKGSGTEDGISFTVDATIDADVTVYSLTANALLRYPKGPLRPYAGFGIGWFFGEIDDGTMDGTTPLPAQEIPVDTQYQPLISGMEAYRDGNYEKALEDFQKALAIFPDDPDIPFYIGLTYLQLNQSEMAIDYFTKTLKRDPEYTDAHFQLGVVLIQKQLYQDAIRGEWGSHLQISF